MKQNILLTAIILVFFTFNAIGQNAEIDANFKITINQQSDNSVYVIDVGTANFANETEANKVLNFYERHPLLSFNLNYAEATLTMTVQDAQLSTNGGIDLNFLNSLLERRSIAYDRKF